MTKSLVERLRTYFTDHYNGPPMASDTLAREAAARIEELERNYASLVESLDEAKYDEPELRSKLDKQRARIEELEAEANSLADSLLHRGNEYLKLKERNAKQEDAITISLAIIRGPHGLGDPGRLSAVLTALAACEDKDDES